MSVTAVSALDRTRAVRTRALLAALLLWGPEYPRSRASNEGARPAGVDAGARLAVVPVAPGPLAATAMPLPGELIRVRHGICRYTDSEMRCAASLELIWQLTDGRRAAIQQSLRAAEPAASRYGPFALEAESVLRLSGRDPRPPAPDDRAPIRGPVCLAEGHQCVADTAGVYCRGDSEYGAIGVLPREYRGGEWVRTPLDAAVPSTLSCNNSTTCIVRNGDEIVCWGEWGRRHPRDDDPFAAVTPTPVLVGRASGVVSLMITYDGVCARTATDVRCWMNPHYDERAIRHARARRPIPIRPTSQYLYDDSVANVCAAHHGAVRCGILDVRGYCPTEGGLAPCRDTIATIESAPPIALPRGARSMVVDSGILCGLDAHDRTWCLHLPYRERSEVPRHWQYVHL